MTPTECGPFRLLKPLGEGGTGRVFHAVDVRSGSPVALKLLRLTDDEGPADPTRDARRGRFLVEAYAARKLSHPRIAAVLAAGEAPPWGWIAMELAPGVALTRYTAPSRLLPEPLVMQAGAAVAEALAHAHAAGVVHRDVKPGNVVVHWPTGSLKLTDFGVARVADVQATRTGIVPGTPAYMAPELLAGAPPDARGDVYALGVMLYELVSGRRPFQGDTLGALLREVSQGTPVPLQTWAPAAHPGLVALIGQMLAPQPGDRPQRASAVSEQLQAWIAGSAPGT